MLTFAAYVFATARAILSCIYYYLVWHCWIWLTFAYVTLSHEAPQEFAAIVAIGRLVKRLFHETVSMLVRQMVIFDGRIAPHGSDRYLHPARGTSWRPSAVGGGATTVLGHVDCSRVGWYCLRRITLGHVERLPFWCCKHFDEEAKQCCWGRFFKLFWYPQLQQGWWPQVWLSPCSPAPPSLLAFLAAQRWSLLLLLLLLLLLARRRRSLSHTTASEATAFD